MIWRIRSPEGAEEFRRIWQFNHRIFAEELHQHPCHEDGLLVDKFHGRNCYRVAVADDGRIVGLLAAHTEPPWSATAKFGPLIDAVAAAAPTAEIRLFAVEPELRGRTTLALQLGCSLFRELEARGVLQLVISAVSGQMPFYRRLGFDLLGKAVRDGGAEFYPMRAELPLLLARFERIIQRIER